LATPKPRPGIYYGWYIVGACFVVLGVEAGAGATFPVFFKPLIDEFGWSRTALSGTVSIGLLVGGLATPLWGSWTDRSGARVVVVTAALFAGLSLFFRGQIGTLLQLYWVAALGALFFGGIGLIPLSTAISQWFRSRRGLAMGLTVVGGGVGEFVGPPLANYLVELVGWRQAYSFLAAAFWLTLLPIAALILRRRPQDLGLLPDGEMAPPVPGDEAAAGPGPALEEEPEGASDADLTLRQAVRTLPFWLIATAFFLPMMSGIGLFTHLVVIFTDMGTSARTASLALGLIGGLSIAGRFGFGFAADRFSVRKAYTGCYVIEALGVSILLTTPWLGTDALFAYVVVYGLTVGGGLVLAPLIVAECFGLKAMGAIFGVLAVAAVVGGAIGPLLAGIIFDTLQTYYPAFVIFTACEATAAVAISQARPPRSRR
jgi:MFS family permease